LQQGDKITLNITGINNEGEGVARTGEEHFVIFVPDVLPGENVECRIVSLKKNYAVGKVVERRNNSSDRTEPLCASFNKCGGCQLQNMLYTAQLQLKRQTVEDALYRIGGEAGHIEVPDCIASPRQWGYRNKASLPVQQTKGNHFLTGFYKKRSHDIVPFTHCPVIMPFIEDAIISFIPEIKKEGFCGFNERNKENVNNVIRHIIFRKAEFTEESLCGIVGTQSLSQGEVSKLIAVAKKRKTIFNGLIFNKNASGGNFIWGDKFSRILGKTVMNESLGNYKFMFEVSSFFQVNSSQALNLYNYVKDLVSRVCPEGKILELYSGIGSLTVFLADVSKSVTAVESWEPASKYILKNAQLNGFNNVRVYSTTAEDIAVRQPLSNYDAIILDPPRTGCSSVVVKSLLNISPDYIIYISCNPATLARDVKLLATDNAYILKSIQPFDMFPQTGHVECVALMSRVQK